MSKKDLRPTLEDIANEIQISRTTIYKVINDKGFVSPKTRETILEALEKYNYVPNNNARNLALNRYYMLALIDFESADAAYFAPIIEKGIQKALRIYKDHGLIIKHYTSGIDNPKQQLEYIQNALDSGIRDFIISAADISLIAPFLDKLKAAGCTTILLSKDIPSAPYDSFIGIDEYKSGLLAGEVLGKMIPDGGNIQVLVANESHSNRHANQARLSGFLDQLKLFPLINVLPLANHLSSPKSIEDAITESLVDTKLAGIFDLTYRLDLICKILHQKNKTDITLVGMDLFPEITPYISDHTINAVIFQNLENQTYLACKLLFENMCYGKKILKTKNYSKLEIVMHQNLEYYLDS